MTLAQPLAKTGSPPYYAVIFASRRTHYDRGYDQMAERTVALASQMPGFLGVESVRYVNGFGITVSYWQSEDAIRQWKAQCRAPNCAKNRQGGLVYGLHCPNCKSGTRLLQGA